MHIIFNKVNNILTPFLRILKILGFRIFYLYISSKGTKDEIEISNKLKKLEIYPLPISSLSKLTEYGVSAIDADPDEKTYKRNLRYVSENILEKYSNLLKISKKSMRLILQDFFFIGQYKEAGYLDLWSNVNNTKKIIFISFNLSSYYTKSGNKNLIRLIFPADLFKHLFKIFKIIVSTQFNKKINSHNSSKNNEFSKKKVALVTHKGITYGSMYEKTHYYSNDVDSDFHKNNILHLDYTNDDNPEKKLYWVCLNKNKILNKKIFISVIYNFFKSIKFVRNFETFLGLFLCAKQHFSYLDYLKKIENFNSIKLVLIEHDCFCPKTLIAAFHSINIKTVTIQDRFLHTFYTSYANVIADTYLVASQKAYELLKKSKYCDVKNFIPIGLPKSEWVKVNKEKDIPEEIIDAKSKDKKIIVSLGYHSALSWHQSEIKPINNWNAQKDFLNDMIKLAEKFKNTFVIIRYKILDWAENDYFKSIIEKVKNCENLMISQDYKEPQTAYKLCANADLIIAKHTSLAEESYINNIPVIFYDYTHNLKKLNYNNFNYPPENLSCYNFDELQIKVQSCLFGNSDKIAEGNQAMKQLLFVKEKSNIKERIIDISKNLIKKQ